MILGLTATATLNTQKSIEKVFSIQNTIKADKIIRENLKLSVTRDKETFKAVELLLKNQFKEGSVIVYCAYKFEIEKLSSYLLHAAINNIVYHADLDQ